MLFCPQLGAGVFAGKWGKFLGDKDTNQGGAHLFEHMVTLAETK